MVQQLTQVLAHVPPEVEAAYPEHRFEHVALGCSGTTVIRICDHNGPVAYLKTGPPASQLQAEAERTQWLAKRLPDTPEVLAVSFSGSVEWMLTAAVPGEPALGIAASRAPEHTACVLAKALRTLHELPVSECPFDARLAQLVPEIRERVKAGQVDESDFDAHRAGRTAEDLLLELERRLPKDEQLVVAHGDPSLPNFILRDDAFVGFVDLGSLAVSDRYRDLAIVARSLGWNLGEASIQPFFAAYGLSVDAERLDFFQLVDEFF